MDVKMFIDSIASRVCTFLPNFVTIDVRRIELLRNDLFSILAEKLRPALFFQAGTAPLLLCCRS